MSPELREYMLSVSLRETELLRDLRMETGKMKNSDMQISPEQGQLLFFLVKLSGARRALEVGVFTGYSSLWTAMALPGDGKLLACDVSREWTDIARDYWERAGVEHKIELRLDPAVQTLEALIEDGDEGTYDFAFIDADKENYGKYYELCLRLMRSGGLMALDNVFRHGRVIDREAVDAGTTAIRELNQRIAVDDRVDVSILPVSDGLTLARKR
jgi:predicted O-methyltransferase YrrM